MKKIFNIFVLGLIMVISFTSCTSYVYVKDQVVGDITVYNDNGDTINIYKNIVLETTDNNGKFDIFLNNNRGLNFYDPNSKKYIIINNAVPVVITYDKIIRYSKNETTCISNKIEYITNDSIVQYREFLENRAVKNVKKNVIKRNK